jgi:hypothetical protein
MSNAQEDSARRLNNAQNLVDDLLQEAPHLRSMRTDQLIEALTDYIADCQDRAVAILRERAKRR